MNGNNTVQIFYSAALGRWEGVIKDIRTGLSVVAHGASGAAALTALAAAVAAASPAWIFDTTNAVPSNLREATS